MMFAILLCLSMMNTASSVEVIAHRGYSSIAPENTLVAIKKAIEIKSQYIEIDVHMSKDGEIVVIHDSTLDRTTNGSGKVFDVNLVDLKKLDAGTWFDSKFSDQKLPILSEILTILGSDSKLIIEVKSGSADYPGIEDRIHKLVRAFGLEKRVIYKSFDLKVLSKFKKIAPKIARLYCFVGSFGLVTIDNFLRFHYATDIQDVDYYQVHRAFVTKKLIDMVHKKGKKIIAWDVHEPQDIKNMISLGIDIIETDYPERILSK